jgi:hypothetical protein
MYIDMDLNSAEVLADRYDPADEQPSEALNEGDYLATAMNPNLEYAATYLPFSQACYVQQSLRAYRVQEAHQSPLQRSYRAKGARLVFVLDALTPDSTPPTVEELALNDTDLPF